MAGRLTTKGLQSMGIKIDAPAGPADRTVGGKHHAPAFAARHIKHDGMNGLERAYAAKLDRDIAAGTVLWWAFDAIKLLVADDPHQPSFYRIDFLVQAADMVLELHETKGFLTEAARLRCKIAASSYPFRFKLVRRLAKKDIKAGGSEWDIVTMGDPNA